jgi:uncharacterized membrane protein
MRTSCALAINDAGVITGYATYTWDTNVSDAYPNPPDAQLLNNWIDEYHYWNWDTHAFIWEGGAMTDLNDLSFGRAPSIEHPSEANKGTSSGIAINQAGVIVGQSDSEISVGADLWNWWMSSGSERAVIFAASGVPQNLNVVTGGKVQYNWATPINDHGAIVGWGARDGFAAFFTNSSGTQFLDVPNPWGGTYAMYANGLNNQDHVVGQVSESDQGLLWVPTRSDLPDNEKWIDLGTLPSSQGFTWTGANAINDHDQIVGGSSQGAVLWQNGKIHKLRDLVGGNPYLSDAVAINQSGMIATNTGGAALLLVPIELKVSSANAPTGSAPKYAESPKKMNADNLFAVWPSEDFTVKVKLPDSFQLPAAFIKWVVPDETIPYNTTEHTFSWNTTGAKRIKVQVSDSEFTVWVDLPNVGTVTQGAALLTVGPITAAAIVLYGTEARDYANQNYGVTPKRDAIRHSYWTALCASDILVDIEGVIYVTTAHEYNNKWGYDEFGNPVAKEQAFNSTMDLRSNLLGSSTVHTQVTGGPDRDAILIDLLNQYDLGLMWIYDGEGSQDQSEGILWKSNQTKIFSD